MFTNIHSPLQQLSHPVLRQLWIKRDDLIDPYISGNKWRKLKYILKEAKTSGKSHLVTFGGAYSNHLVATAAAAARANLKSTAFVRGEAVTNEMLLLCKLYGMNLIFVDRTSYKEKNHLYNQHFAEDPESMFIDEGGAGQLALEGCAEIIDELPQDIDHLFCAAGTGTTAAGLLKGLTNNHSKCILHVVPVLKAPNYIGEQIANFTSGSTARLQIHEQYHFGGYAKVNDELITFIQSFIRSTGILIDPVYTAKLFYAIDDLSKQGLMKANSKIVALHTGGLLGMFGMKDKLAL